MWQWKFSHYLRKFTKMLWLTLTQLIILAWQVFHFNLNFHWFFQTFHVFIQIMITVSICVQMGYDVDSDWHYCYTDQVNNYTNMEHFLRGIHNIACRSNGGHRNKLNYNVPSDVWWRKNIVCEIIRSLLILLFLII